MGAGVTVQASEDTEDYGRLAPARQQSTRSVLTSLTMLILFCIVLIGFLGATWQNYQMYYEIRLHNLHTSRSWVSKVCSDAYSVESLQVQTLCNEHKNVVERDPYAWAVTDTMQHWKICGPTGCHAMLIDSVNTLVLVFFSLVILCIVLIGIVGIVINRFRWMMDARRDLPSFVGRAKDVIPPSAVSKKATPVQSYKNKTHLEDEIGLHKKET